MRLQSCFAIAFLLTACTRTGGRSDVSSQNFQEVIQDYLDREQTVSEVLEFTSPEMACGTVDGRQTCEQEVRASLPILIQAGLVSVENQSPARTVYRTTAKGEPYIHPRGVVHMESGPNGTHQYYGFGITIGHSIVTIDSFTKPGVDAEGAEAVTVWFTANNRPYEWARPWVAQLGKQSRVGQSASENAHLVMTDKGWRVTSIRVDWPVHDPFIGMPLKDIPR